MGSAEPVGFCNRARARKERTMKITMEQQINAAEIGTEDAGCAKIVQIDRPTDSSLFVRLQSRDETHAHADLAGMIGRCARVTVEVID